MRYYNENPQVAYLKEKCEELEKKNAKLNECIDELEKEVQRQSSFRRAEYYLYQDWKKLLQSDCDKVICTIEHFNALPWYKKMFYKFKI